MTAARRNAHADAGTQKRRPRAQLARPWPDHAADGQDAQGRRGQECARGKAGRPRRRSQKGARRSPKPAAAPVPALLLLSAALPTQRSPRVLDVDSRAHRHDRSDQRSPPRPHPYQPARGRFSAAGDRAGLAGPGRSSPRADAGRARALADVSQDSARSPGSTASSIATITRSKRSSSRRFPASRSAATSTGPPGTVAGCRRSCVRTGTGKTGG